MKFGAWTWVPSPKIRRSYEPKCENDVKVPHHIIFIFLGLAPRTQCGGGPGPGRVLAAASGPGPGPQYVKIIWNNIWNHYENYVILHFHMISNFISHYYHIFGLARAPNFISFSYFWAREPGPGFKLQMTFIFLVILFSYAFHMLVYSWCGGYFQPQSSEPNTQLLTRPHKYCSNCYKDDSRGISKSTRNW